jgi:hypothetical protein
MQLLLILQEQAVDVGGPHHRWTIDGPRRKRSRQNLSGSVERAAFGLM